MGILQRESLRKRKIPVTSSWIEHAFFRLAAQFLNQMRHRIPYSVDHKYRVGEIFYVGGCGDFTDALTFDQED